jgi:phage terminase large subunit-like protein
MSKKPVAKRMNSTAPKTTGRFSKHPNCYAGHKYAEEVIAGKVVACKYIRGACERYLADLDNTAAAFYFDAEAAERYLRLVQKFEHVEGHWPTKEIIYEPWQCWVWMNIVGFKMKDTDFRRFRVAHLEVARGSAKSTMASQLCLYFLALDNPNGNHVSTVATKRDQARIVLDSARAMAKKNKSFLRSTGVEVLAHTIVHEASNSVVRAQSADKDSLDGLKDVLAVCDELHVMNRAVFEVIYSGMSKRKDSLLMCITTAGHDTNSVGYFQTQFAKKVSTGEVQDDSFFAAVYTIDEEDDWDDEKCWIKANPNLGVSVDLDSLRAKVQKALVTPSDIANIRIKHMNQWISEANAFFDLRSWDACEDRSLRLEDFKGKAVRLGLDLASHIDLASIGYVFKEKDASGEWIYYIFERSFLPEATIAQKKNPFYDTCLVAGELIATRGEALDHETIKENIKQAGKDFAVQECMFDPWNNIQLAQQLSDEMEMVKFAQNVGNFSEPMKKLDSFIRSKKVRHNGSSLLRWCIGNVVSVEDRNGNHFPRKSHEKLKIDPVVAILMGLAGWLAAPEVNSVYELRGIRVL